MTTQVEKTMNGDLNAVIVGAVNARVEAAMMEALSGDETIGHFVTAALRQTVEMPKRDGRYGTEHVPFLTKILTETIQKAAQEACRRLIEEELPTLEDEIRKALRRNISGIANTLATSLGEAAQRAYGVNVNLELRMPNG